MKHIRKKYLFEEKKENVNYEALQAISDKLEKSGLTKKAKNFDHYVLTDKDLILKAFVHKYGSREVYIPIPDLSLVYFDAAYRLNKLRKEQEKELFEKLTPQGEKLSEDVTNEIYGFYGYSSSCIIALFTALESFINHILPDDKEYKNELNNKTEIYSKEQIQRHIFFKEKVTKVLPSFFGKSFFAHQTPTNQHINNLKDLRDEIVHTKSEKTFKSQEELIKRVIKFKYDETFEAVASFINFYKPDLIVECDCGADF